MFPDRTSQVSHSGSVTVAIKMGAPKSSPRSTSCVLLPRFLVSFNVQSSAADCSLYRKITCSIAVTQEVTMSTSSVRPALLPEELLHKIFRAYISESQADRSLAPNFWLAITHVCRRCRCLALQNPKLWTQTVAAHPESLSVILERSKSLPLSMKFPSRFDLLFLPDREKVLDLLNSNRHRIVHLELDDMTRIPDYGEEFISGRWDHPLASLKISCYDFSWTDSIFCRSLKKLEIYHSPSPTVENLSATSLPKMFDALRRMP